jgi:hypothetical protein
MIRRLAQAFVIVIGFLIMIAETERFNAQREDAMRTEYLDQLPKGWK